MTASNANRAVLYLILGFVAANLALAMRMNATTVFRAEIVKDMNDTTHRLTRMEENQRVYLINQRLAMKKLGVTALEPNPATQP